MTRLALVALLLLVTACEDDATDLDYLHVDAGGGGAAGDTDETPASAPDAGAMGSTMAAPIDDTAESDAGADDAG